MAMAGEFVQAASGSANVENDVRLSSREPRQTPSPRPSNVANSRSNKTNRPDWLLAQREIGAFVGHGLARFDNSCRTITAYRKKEVSGARDTLAAGSTPALKRRSVADGSVLPTPSLCGDCFLRKHLADAADLGSDSLELFFDVLVATVDVVNAVNDGLTVSDQRS